MVARAGQGDEKQARFLVFVVFRFRLSRFIFAAWQRREQAGAAPRRELAGRQVGHERRREIPAPWPREW
jgi:hypothetical protein